MALIQKLLIRQTQALVMTPQLMQAIKLLQLSHLDLAAYVDGELERNPLLERPADQDQVRDDGETAAETPSASEEEPASADWMDDRLESRQSLIDGRQGRKRRVWFGLVPVSDGVEVV